ncbi:MAG TPA: PAS domain S-box protein [Chitinophagaceae bacterium]|nr:PAS domain S-box protein [Chitinophagaceae bacterium]HPH30293.1 PAS domain S-box protein [Chitinophagaceae bacterium]HPN57641.1 PAS domain S-box protein [Chitinophagaceae bacterium]
MNRIYTRQSITIAVVITFVLVSFFAWYSYVNMKRARYETLQVNKTLQSLKVLENLMDDVQDIETANRGFLISANRDFLTPYDAAISNLSTDTTAILSLDGISESRKDSLKILVRLTNKKLKIAAQTEALVSKNKVDSALLLVRSGTGMEIMDSIRNLVLALETTDRKVLNSSNSSREIAATNTARLFVILSICFILLTSLIFFIIHRDLKRKEQYEARIAYLAELTERTSDAIISIDPQQIVISWNKGAHNIYGYSSEEAIGRKISELIQSSALENGDQDIQREIAIKGGIEFESNDFTKDGKSIYCHISATALRDVHGKLTGFVSVVRDITQRKLAEKLIYEFNHELAAKVKEKTEDIRKGEEKLRQVLDSAAGEFYVIDLDYRVILMSRMAEVNLESVWKHVIRSGDRIIDFIPENRKEVVLESYNRAFGGETIEYETRVESGQQLRWVSIQLTPVRNEFNEITGAFVGTRDISARKNAEAGLQESESRYRTLVEQATETIVLVDERGHFIQVNEAGVRLLGYSREEVMLMSLMDILVLEPGDPPLRFEQLRTGASILSNRKVRRKDGVVIELELSTKMLSNGHFIGIGRDISERMQVQKALTESENRFRAIFNTQLNMVTLLDKDGRILETNKTALAITGYRNEEVIGRYFWDIRLWQNEEERTARIEKVKEAITRAAAGELIRYEGQISLKEGEVEVVDLSIKPIPGVDGKPMLLIMEGRLITEIKKAENEVKESEAKFRSFFEYSMDGILLSSPDGAILSANPAACQMFGMSEAEIVALGRAGLIDQEDERIHGLLDLRERMGYLTGELSFVRKDGTKFPGEFSSAIFKDAFGRERTSLIIRDVTERKRIEEEIRQSNKRFEMISRTTNDAIWEWNILTGRKWANENHQQLYGLTIEDPVPEEYVWRSRIHPDDRALIVSRQESTLASEKNVFISEYRFLNGENEYVYLFDRCYIERDDAGKPLRMTGSMMDISDRKRSEEQLMESEQRLRLSMEAAKQGLYDLNIKTGEAIVNEQYALMLEYDPRDFNENNELWLERMHPDDLPAAQKAFADYVSGITGEFRTEFRQRTQSGKWKWILSIGKILEYDDQGNALRMLGTHTDINSLKNAEEELIRTQKRFQNLVENISGVYWVNDLETQHTLYISPSYETVWGRKCEDLYRNPADFVKSVHPDDLKKLVEAYHRIAEKKQFNLNYRIIRPQGDIRWIAVKINVVSGADGRRMEYGYAEDITEQRKAETDLLESNARFQIVSRATSDLVWDWNLLAGELWWNDNYYSSLGYRKTSELVDENEWYDRIHPDERERVRLNANKTFKGKSSVWRDEYRYRKADGSYLHFLDRGFIMRDPGGQAIRMIGSMIDMTPIYTVQRKIEESEMRLRTILDTDPECIKLMDEDACLLDINRAGLQMIEAASIEMVKGKSVLPLIDEGQQQQAIRLIKDAFKGKSGTLEFQMITLKGMKRWCELSVVPFLNTDKKIISALGVTKDITERKQAETAVRVSEEKYRTLVEQAADSIALYDSDGILLDTNTSASRLLGYSREDFSQMKLSDVLLPEDIVVNPVQFDVLSSGISTVKIRRMRRKDGTVVITEVRSQQLPDGRFLSVIRDMTERIKAEEELKSSYNAVRSLTAHLQNIREEERTNIAREIHDELGQQLTVLKMDVAWLNKRFQGTDDKVNQRLKDLLIMLDETVQSVRRISSQLRPSLLDDLGLTAAMEWQLGEFEKRAGIKTSFEAPQDEIPVPEAAKTALFRIFQESLTNVVRHSEAKKLAVSVKEADNCLVMTIADNGKGFDPMKVAEKKTLGILGMKERTEMIGGTYIINSLPGQGTSVIVSVPVI